MGESVNLGQLALNKRSFNAGRKACDVKKVLNISYVVEFTIYTVDLFFVRPCSIEVNSKGIQMFKVSIASISASFVARPMASLTFSLTRKQVLDMVTATYLRKTMVAT